MSLKKRLFTAGASGLTGTEHFNTITYTGNNTYNGVPQAITTVGFPPDYFWIKDKANYEHFVGFNSSDNTAHSSGLVPFSRITSYHYVSNAGGGVDDFLSNGFSLLSDFNTNANGVSYAAWNWKCGGEVSVDNTATSGAMTANSVSVDGALQSSYTPSGSPSKYPKKMSVNTVAGQSLITYVGPNGGTIPHGLTQAPELIWWGVRANQATRWVWSNQLSTNFVLKLSDPAAQTNNNGILNSSLPTSTLIPIGTNVAAGDSGYTYMLMAVHSVDGYSKIGKYTGNGSTSNAITGLGFTPRFVMIKAINRTGEWIIVDSERGEGKSMSIENRPENGRVSANSFSLDSDGFTIETSDTDVNSNGYNYLYYAIA